METRWPSPCAAGERVGSTKPTASATLRSSASGHMMTPPYTLAVTMLAPLPTACARPPLCACIAKTRRSQGNPLVLYSQTQTLKSQYADSTCMHIVLCQMLNMGTIQV